jgi:hypothetical protein
VGYIENPEGASVIDLSLVNHGDRPSVVSAITVHVDHVVAAGVELVCGLACLTPGPSYVRNPRLVVNLLKLGQRSTTMQLADAIRPSEPGRLLVEFDGLKGYVAAALVRLSIHADGRVIRVPPQTVFTRFMPYGSGALPRWRKASRSLRPLTPSVIRDWLRREACGSDHLWLASEAPSWLGIHLRRFTTFHGEPIYRC